jgi:LacI family transcriptional regulator
MKSMRSRPKVGLLIETSNSYGRELLLGVRRYLREHQSCSIHFAEAGRGQILHGWLKNWKGDGIIARIENPVIAENEEDSVSARQFQSHLL